MRERKGSYMRGAIAFAVCALVSMAARFMWPQGCMSTVLLVSLSDLGKGKILSVTGENSAVVKLSDRKRIIFCLLMALMINAIPSVAASHAGAQLIPHKQSESWATVVGIAVALVGVALAIVSTSWLSRNRVPDLEGQQLLQPEQAQEGAILLDIEQALFLDSDFRINERRSLEDYLALPTIAE